SQASHAGWPLAFMFVAALHTACELRWAWVVVRLWHAARRSLLFAPNRRRVALGIVRLCAWGAQLAAQAGLAADGCGHEACRFAPQMLRFRLGSFSDNRFGFNLHQHLGRDQL